MAVTSFQTACDQRPAAEQVGELVLARWDAIRSGQMEEAYNQMASSYRERTTFDKFRGSFGSAVGWTDIRVTTIDCEGAACRAVVEMDFVTPLAAGLKGTSSHTEHWTFDDADKAWRYERRS